MRSAPTLKIWMTPLASVAILEKLALLKIALCSAPAVSRASVGRTSMTASGTETVRLRTVDILGPGLSAAIAAGGNGGNFLRLALQGTSRNRHYTARRGSFSVNRDPTPMVLATVRSPCIARAR